MKWKDKTFSIKAYFYLNPIADPASKVVSKSIDLQCQQKVQNHNVILSRHSDVERYKGQGMIVHATPKCQRHNSFK